MRHPRISIQKLPSGKYVVTDPSYVLNEIDYLEIRSQVLNECASGEIIDHNGDKLIVFETYFGDDIYEDLNGNKYPVDDGMIAAIPLDMCNNEFLKDILENGFGQLIITDAQAVCFNDDGVITIGEISIDTKKEFVYENSI